jgi:hypothetical protein
MATNHSDPPTDDVRPETGPRADEAPGIAHLTVVPENADRSA